jgi:hypothetical protein
VTIGGYTFAIARLACTFAMQSISGGFNLLHGYKVRAWRNARPDNDEHSTKECLPATRRLTTNAHRDFCNSIDNIFGMR